MSKISRLLPIVTLFTLFLFLSACGNKGELYRESDEAALKELEEAAEKLKKQKKQSEQTSPEPEAE